MSTFAIVKSERENKNEFKLRPGQVRLFNLPLITHSLTKTKKQ